MSKNSPLSRLARRAGLAAALIAAPLAIVTATSESSSAATTSTSALTIVTKPAVTSPPKAGGVSVTGLPTGACKPPFICTPWKTI